MLRKILVCLSAFLLVSCGRSNDREATAPLQATTAPYAMIAGLPAAPPPDIQLATKNPNALFSQLHNLTVTMPHDSVAARFEKARDSCLNDKSLHCTLTSASLTANTTVSAELQVALPHDEVPVYEKLLLKRLPQDGAGKVEVTSRSTTTENETQSVADTDRQLTQAISYRDSLEGLAKRPNLTVDEVIKIHSELQQAQEAVETAEASKRATDSRVVLETMTIALEERVVSPEPPSPFADFWSNAGDVLAASTADMLLRLVSALPWLPVILVVLLVLSRFFRRSPRTRRPPPETAKDGT